MRSFLSCLLLIALAHCAACGGDPATPVLPRPGGLTVSAPDLVVTGRPFALTVTALDADGDLDTGFAGAVDLAASLGSFSPATITLTAGTGTADVVLSGAFGSVTVTAQAGQRAGEAVIATVAVGELPGATTAAAAPAVPAMDYVPDLGAFTDDHPDLPGMWLSFSQVLVSLAPGTTVGQVNAMLAGVGAIIVGGIPGPAGGGGTLALLLPAADHDTAAPLLAQVEGDPSVAVVAPDILLGGTMIPRDNDAFPDAWTWALPPAGDNWGIEHIRAPQAWNLNAAIVKAGSTGPVTDVIDAGFATNHPDIVWHQLLSPAGQSEHGTHVAGTIGATFDNGLGVDGVNPFARIRAIGPNFYGSVDSLATRASFGMTMTAIARGTTISGARLINMSLGYNWYQAGIDANNSLAARIIAGNQGLIFATMLNDLAAMGVGIPLLVVAAGNESNSFGATVDARWASPMTNAALEHGAVDVLVVEAVGMPGAAGAPAWRAAFSNPGGRISAPGVAIVSLSHPAPYAALNGTSMATPHVTGAAGYLLALAPELTNGQLRGALLRSTQPTTGGASTCLDLFASALNIDWARGDERILHRLLDIDDGSADGNLRLDDAGQTVNDEDLDGDGGPGDGRIDMRDFRRWRDWLLQVEDDAALVLDGAPDHTKRDVNGNGTVESAAQENRYPRGDFNGDGRLDRNAARLVDGAVDAVLSDLGVLQRAFVDPHVAAAELLGLRDSGDLAVDATSCLNADPAAVRAVTEVRPAGGGAVLAARTHLLDADEPYAARQIITLPVGDYDLAFTVYDAGDGELATDQWTAAVGLGADLRWAPTCEPPVGTLVIHLLEWPASYAVDETLDLRFAVAYAQPGAAEVPAAGAVFTIDVQGGTTANPVGVVGGDGEVTTSVLPSAESVEVMISVQGDNDASATLGLSSDLVTGTVALTRNFTVFWGDANFVAAPEECWDGPGVIQIGETDFSDISLSLTVGCSVTDNRPPLCVGTNSGTASGSLNVVYNRDPVDGRLLSIQASSTQSSVGSAEPPPGCRFYGGAVVGGVFRVEFEVTGDVTYRATGSFSSSGENFFSVRAGDYIDTVTDPAGFEEVGELSDGIYDVFASLRNYDGSWTFLMEFGP